MIQEDKDYIKRKIENEGFHYCFVSYSRFEDIEDEEFHRLRLNYLDAIEKIKNYINEENKDENNN